MKSASCLTPITFAMLLAATAVVAYEFVELPTLGGREGSVHCRLAIAKTCE
ncbi:MAG: hypothetical protein ACUVXJ_03200 [Phycisphaerae bacterium]